MKYLETSSNQLTKQSIEKTLIYKISRIFLKLEVKSDNMLD